MKHSQLFDRAQQVIPGGVNSPVRAFTGVGGTPLFIDHAKGAYLFDEQGKAYIDYVGSWGPMILGHAHPTILEAIERYIRKGLSFGAPNISEILLAEKITKMVPSIQQVRMVNSGTEASMSAIRLARGHTNRNKILKFNGCYHGHCDSLLVKAGSGVMTLSIPGSPGIPNAVTQDTLLVEFNNLTQVQQCFEQFGDDIAAVIVEPIAGNMNFITPTPEFLPGLRSLCNQYGAILILDEVMTGFRVAKGGAQAYYQIEPDLTILGKIIGAGMPVGAFGGKKSIMQSLAPQGPVYQAGTLSGNPVAMTAGLTQLELLDSMPHAYEALHHRSQYLIEGLMSAASTFGIPFHASSISGLFGFYFGEKAALKNYQEVCTCDVERFKAFFHLMLEQGIYFAPSAFEAGFISLAHTQEDIEKTIEAAKKVFAQL